MILLHPEEMGVRAACRPITNSIHLLIIPLLLLCSEWTSSDQQGAPRSTAGRAHSYPRTSLYITSSPSLSLTYCICTLAVLHSHIEKTSRSIATMTSGSIGTYYFDISPVGEHTEKKTSDTTGFHILLWCKFQLFL